MLALPRSTRAVHKFSHHVRALSAVAPSTASPEIAGAGRSDVDNSRTHHQQEGLTKSGTECMFVYPWNGIRSSAEGLAVARAVQDKYGRAKEIVFPRVRQVLMCSPGRLLTPSHITGPRQYHRLPSVLLDPL
jgi:hypothetical protein